MHSRVTLPARPARPAAAGALARIALLASAVILAAGLAPPASATVRAVSIVPTTPTPCDSIRLIVDGALPSPCHSILGFRVGAPEALPTMGPIPTYRIRATVRAEEPDPAIQPNCVTVLEPYRLSDELGKLPFGRYWVEAREYLYAFPAGAAAPIDSSVVYFDFSVGGADSCGAGVGCALFGFAEAGTGIEPRTGCTARTLPGGRACFDVTLANDTPVGAFQTVVAIPPGGGAWAVDFPNLIVPVEVTATPRAAGFQVAWVRDETRTKIVVYSTTGAVIQPGRGPVLHLCYDIGKGTPEGSYGIAFGPTLVSTPRGDVMPLCPTFAEILGRLCVGENGCDLNGDGVGDVRDILRLVRCVLSDSSDACPDSVRAKADCNADALVDVRDIVCCVRKSLISDAAWGPISGVPSPAPTDLSTMGFDGPVEAINDLEIRAVLTIGRSASFGGVQFLLDPGSAARVARVWLDDPTGASTLDWQRVADGTARVMIYDRGDRGTAAAGAAGAAGAGTAGAGTAGAGAPSRSLSDALDIARVVVTLERTPGSTADGNLRIRTVRGATSTGDALGLGGVGANVALPASPVLTAPTILPVRPNPFVSDTEISFALPGPGSASVRLFDVNGRLVRTLHEGATDAGVHRLRWDGRDDGGRPVGVGIYFVRLAAGKTLRTERILRLR